jgi:type IV pilus assembly protein PilO
MPDLRGTRRKLKIGLGVMLCLDVAAAAVLLSPLAGSEHSRRQELQELWRQLQQKTREVEPLRGLDKKIVLAGGQINEFYKSRLPDQDSAISSELSKLTSASGVTMSQAKYAFKDPEPVGLRRVEIETSLSGDYLQLVRFINAVERDPLFFTITKVELGGEQAGTVKLQMKLETYLKTGA